MADCAARIFAASRTTKSSDRAAVKRRKLLRQPAVETLRYLWKTGDPSQREAVACRVAVWMKRPVEGLGKRIRNREKARFKEMALRILIANANEMPP